MDIENGQVVTDSADAILAAMVTNFETRTGEELPEDAVTGIRNLYGPVAEVVAELQEGAGLVLSAAQLDNATGAALDLLVSIINVSRKPATRATGVVTFSRSEAATTDYPIPKGTVVNTPGAGAVEFETTESATLASGTTSVDAPIRAVARGPRGNVGADTITRIGTTVSGPESVTNVDPTVGGRVKESDSELRTRAKGQLAAGASGTAPALVSAVMALDVVDSASIFINDGGPDSDTSLPANSFELVAECEGTAEILDTVAQAIMDNKAITDTVVNGYNGTGYQGTATLVNGQTFGVYISLPNVVQIHVDADLQTGADYPGATAVQDSIINYIGGTLSTGYEAKGELRVDDDVIYNKVLGAVMEIEGVEDINSLTVDTVDPPAGTANILIDGTSIASTDTTTITVV